MAPLYDRLVISFTIVKEISPPRTRGEAPMEAATAEPAGSSTTRERLVEAAVRLFTRHGFAGTSLQMIADELGFTKAAIYYHFRTREQLLTAALDPILEQ